MLCGGTCTHQRLVRLSLHRKWLHFASVLTLVRSDFGSRPPQSFLATLRSIYTSTLTLPPAIRTLCFVQFFAWIGWFPILFFTSVWVSDIYTRAALALPDSPWKSASDVGLYEEATRAGSRALFWNAVVAFVTAVLMPLLVAKSHKQEETGEPGWLEKLGVPEAAREWVGRWEGLSLGWVWVGSHVSDHYSASFSIQGTALRSILLLFLLDPFRHPDVSDALRVFRRRFVSHTSPGRADGITDA